MYYKCIHCNGTGQLYHPECEMKDLEPVKEYKKPFGWKLGVYRCRVCGKLWKISSELKGSGINTWWEHTWLPPGTYGRWLVFSFEEALELGGLEGIISHGSNVVEKFMKKLEEIKNYKGVDQRC